MWKTAGFKRTQQRWTLYLVVYQIDLQDSICRVLKILRYSIHHPEIVGWDNITTDNKIERLMRNNF